MTTFPDLSRFDRVAVDTETTGVKWRDRPVGLSLSLPDGRDFYFSWGHEAGGNNCTLADVIRWGRQAFKRTDLIVAMHNASFDLRMLANVGLDLTTMGCRVEDTGIISAILNELEPSLALDDLATKHAGISKNDDALNEWCARAFRGHASRKSQAKNYWRAPGDLVGEYAKGDSRMTLALYDVRRPLIAEQGLSRVYTLECDVLPVVHRMNQVGVRIDVDKARRVQGKLRDQVEIWKREWDRLTGGANYNSTPELAALFRKLGLPVWATELGNDSITADLLKTIDHPVAQMITKIKKAERYANVFIQRYILDVVGPDGRLHPEFHQVRRAVYGTVSGRFSSGGELNAQNFPSPDKDPEWATLIRALLIPESEDHWWAKFDYSQIEYRYLAHYAGGQLRQAYLDNPHVDFHQALADLTGLGRKDAKNLNFAICYGQGRDATARQLGKDLDEAQKVLDQYHGRVPEVRQLYTKAMRLADRRGWIQTWGGRMRRFEKNPRGWGHKHTHKALNALLQGSAADLIKMAMVEVDKIVDWRSSVIHLTVHDELDPSIPKGDDRMVRDIKDAMQSFDLTVPVIADAEVGPNWGEVQEWREAA